MPEQNCRTTNTQDYSHLSFRKVHLLARRDAASPHSPSACRSLCDTVPEPVPLSGSQSSGRHRGKGSGMHESPSKYRCFCHQYRLECDCGTADWEEMKSSDPSPDWETGRRCWVQRSNIDQSVPDYRLQVLFPDNLCLPQSCSR